MKSVVQAVLALSIAFAHPAIATTKPHPAQSTAPTAAHVKAVQDLLSAMQVENVMRRVAYRSRFPTEAQRKAAFAKLDKTPPAEIHRRLAVPMAMVISADTALEMTRFYTTPYGKQVIYRKYNSGPQIVMPGAQTAVPKEEKKERKRAAYVLASKELADAEATLEHEAFKLLQKLHSEKR